MKHTKKMKNLIKKRGLLWISVCFFSLLFSVQANAKEIHVAKNGKNSNPGTKAKPFVTIQKAADVANPGDVIIIHKGVYREQVKVKKGGRSGNYITFKNFKNDYVEISAFDVAPKKWKRHNKTFFKIENYNLPLAADHNLLLVNKQLCWLARWPNKTNNNLFDLQMKKINKGTKSSVTVSGMPNISNEALKKDAIVMYYGNPGWITWRSPIASRSGNTLNLRKPAGFEDFNHTPDRGDGHVVLMNSLFFLDADREFFYEKGRKILYFRAPGGQDPNNTTVEVRKRTTLFDASNKQNIKLQGITIFGGAAIFDGSHNSKMFNCRVIMGNYLMGFGAPERSGGYVEGFAVDARANNMDIEKCEIGYATGTAVRLYGTGGKFVNNHMHNVGWIRTYSAGLILSTVAKQKKVLRNSMYFGGRALIQGDGNQSNEIAYNDMYKGCLTTKDAGIIYDCCESSNNGTNTIHHNWIHDAPGKFSSGIYYDNEAGGFNESLKVRLHHNLIWNTNNSGIQINGGKFIDIFNNSLINTRLGFYTWSGRPIKNNSKVKVFNNYVSVGNFFDGQPVTRKNNVKASVSNAIENFSQKKYFPKVGSPLLNKGVVINGITENSKPDVGAYERGGENWRAGASWKPNCAIKQGIFTYRANCINKVSKSTLSVEEDELLETMKVFPNPTTGKLFIKMGDVKSDEVSVSLKNITGQEVFNNTIPLGQDNTAELDVSNQPAGFYLMTLSNEGKQTTKKVLIK
ncbi:T9SS type A sorting domain-containing protein [Flavivirga abyssicola]|uniref:T9SS type A sorting domain-containing protein n=1 Tax=Flavivirga abyssicola TaxID=3063533 RepID=UPI0026DF5FA4|nr:T9SS type A sorting domain-containing protein [Flavivirga sp. MEBiC07777]WVK13493.1 T9SS type A sorting domain-containing protein [Flavivirga sp. MEBiC07777]